jgi:hypothetical protein
MPAPIGAESRGAGAGSMGGGAGRAATPQAPLGPCLRPGHWSAEEDGHLNHGLSRVRAVPGPGVGAGLTACAPRGGQQH